MGDLIAELDALEARVCPAPWRLNKWDRLQALTSMDHPLCKFSDAYHRQYQGTEALDPEFVVALRNAWPKLREQLRAPSSDGQDAGRLDWLDEQMQRVYVAPNKTRYSTPTDICIALGRVSIYQRDERGGNANEGHGDTIRAAIDTAIAREVK